MCFDKVLNNLSPWIIIYAISYNVNNVDSKVLKYRQMTFENVYDVSKRGPMFD